MSAVCCRGVPAAKSDPFPLSRQRLAEAYSISN